MKNIFTFLCVLSFGLNTLAQDTTTIQTLEFSDISKRRGWFFFPPDTGGVRKVTMKYTLKCDPQTGADSYNCGEWDYTTLCNLFSYEGIGTPYYILNGSTADTLYYTNNLYHNYYQSYDHYPVYNSTANENDYTIGSGSLNLTEAFETTHRNGRTQYLFTATELTSAGVTAGDIHKIRLDLNNVGGTLENLTLSMKTTALSELTPGSYETSGLIKVLTANTNLTPGIYTFNLAIPFNWDGTSNIVIDFAFTNNNYPSMSGNEHVSHTSGFNSGVSTASTNGYLKFSRPEYVQVPGAAFTSIDSFVTVSFWAWGDETTMPFNSYAFQAVDSNDNRVFSAHLPWSNSNIFWDAGNSGTANYDRIDKTAVFSEFAGQWNHYAFVKDASTGTMQIYINGNLWHSGTGKSRTMAGITSMRIGGATDGGRYDGNIDEFRVWNAALTATEIQDYMFKSVDATHPKYTNLLVAYDFDMVNNLTTTDYSPNAHIATLIGAPQYHLHNAETLSFNMLQTTTRPNTTFVQGTYVITLDSSLILDSIPVNNNTLIEQTTSRNLAASGLIYTPIDTSELFAANYYTYTYAANGDKIDSTWVQADGYHLNTLKTITHQIQNYVTPYGIGIDLGPNGFRWEYEVTDYLPILSDTLELRAGNQQELIDLKFEFISGTPARDIIDFETIWTGNYQHANIANDVSMPAVTLNTNPLATQYALKTRATGHWFGGFENCAEFCPKEHNIAINGNQEFAWTVWKDCGSNPIIDQGGTWIYDRAGWCPGTFANTYDYDITPLVTPGSPITIDYGMETTAGGMEGNYWVALQMISYGNYNHQTDAEVMQIIAPNNWEFYNRNNPICSQPVVVIRNLGEDTLTSVDIAYRPQGGIERIFKWTGSLSFMEEEVVELDHQGLWWWQQHNGSGKFEVELRNPNGVADENMDNDKLISTYEAPVELPNHFYFWFQANNAGNESSYRLLDWEDNVIFERNNWTNLTVYRDTFMLANGCYTLELNDSDEDGLSFFANSDGSGFFRYRPVSGGAITTLEPNFGDQTIMHFTVGGVLDVNDLSSDAFVTISVINVLDFSGKQVYREELPNVVGGFDKALNFNHLSAGIYVVNITDGTHRGVKRLVIE